MNVSFVRNSGLCMGCGTCESVCPMEAIQIRLNEKKGIYLPSINNHCTQCGLCLKICPGISVDIEKLTNEFIDGNFHDKKIKKYEACYIGHAISEDIRFNSASGGLVTSLLIYALERKIIDGALVLGMSRINPIETEPIIATTPAEIIDACGSKYCPSSINKELRQLLSKKEKGHFAVVGLPCHIHAIRKWESMDKKIHDTIVLHFGLFCANNNTYNGTKYFLNQNRILPDKVSEIRYRGYGWPGKIRIKLTDNTIKNFPRAINETNWYRKALFSSAFHYDFMIPRCQLCPDHTCELADMSFGDPWLKDYIEKDQKGSSIVIVRLTSANQIIKEAMRDKAISLESINLDILYKAQNYTFKEEVGARIYLRKIGRLAVPDYSERELSYSRSSILRALRYIPSYCSHYSLLWPVIRLFAAIHYLEKRFIAKIKIVVRNLIRRINSMKDVRI